ncbi:hypothetical protein RXP20_28810, partial [Pseudomonas aeruginosa]|nr:hypothetical protein [Pseudomonas aeruginosa]
TSTLVQFAPGDPGSARPKPTAHRETSAARAPLRALAEYLRTLTFPIDGQAAMAFKAVLDRKAEPEEMASYPSACVYCDSEVSYSADEGALGNQNSSDDDLPDGKSTLFMPAEMSFSAIIHAWTNEDFHREQLLMMLEDGLNPVEWMS